MPTLQENQRMWNREYDWKKVGNEWSAEWGSPHTQWYTSILPRIYAYIPAPTILEIAPGFGRWTHYLVPQCKKLLVVDLAEKCIQACKERFREFSHIEYHVNDGRSLDFITNDSVDFVFSFDSLVHAEIDVLEAYVTQLARKLNSNGVAFLHHSNLGEYSTYYRITNFHWRARDILLKTKLTEPLHIHWRALSVTAARFRKIAADAGLSCISQEVINWQSKRLIDCISVVTTYPLQNRWAAGDGGAKVW